MTKACALIGPLRGVLKKTLPGVGSFLESVSALFGASEAFLILVTLYEKAKQKSSRGGGEIFGFFYTVDRDNSRVSVNQETTIIPYIILSSQWFV